MEAGSWATGLAGSGGTWSARSTERASSQAFRGGEDKRFFSATHFLHFLSWKSHVLIGGKIRKH